MNRYSVTITSHLSVNVNPLYVVEALIVALPADSPSTTPPDTLAIKGFELDHVTLPPEGHVVALRVSVSPSLIATACSSSTTP